MDLSLPSHLYNAAEVLFLAKGFSRQKLGLTRKLRNNRREPRGNAFAETELQ